ncbi:unnamed protein product [Periconia digitata]|uniref:Uncharacterized protein n=1 Tax=Periconia digitata TaxID=1303443 RepID=A0A9W4U3T7_9PLEO|nr:unnamed protein product [Periconia digitata]
MFVSLTISGTPPFRVLSAFLSSACMRYARSEQASKRGYVQDNVSSSHCRSSLPLQQVGNLAALLPSYHPRRPISGLQHWHSLRKHWQSATLHVWRADRHC